MPDPPIRRMDTEGIGRTRSDGSASGEVKESPLGWSVESGAAYSTSSRTVLHEWSIAGAEAIMRRFRRTAALCGESRARDSRGAASTDQFTDQLLYRRSLARVSGHRAAVRRRHDRDQSALARGIALRVGDARRHRRPVVVPARGVPRHSFEWLRPGTPRPGIAGSKINEIITMDEYDLYINQTSLT